MRSRSFIAHDAHFYLRTMTGEYKKTRWTEFGVVRLREDLADALSYVEEMHNLSVSLERKAEKKACHRKMPPPALTLTTPAAPSNPLRKSAHCALPGARVSTSSPSLLEQAGASSHEQAGAVPSPASFGGKDKRTKSKRQRRGMKDKKKKQQQYEKERSDMTDKLNS